MRTHFYSITAPAIDRSEQVLAKRCGAAYTFEILINTNARLWRQRGRSTTWRVTATHIGSTPFAGAGSSSGDV